MHALEAKTSENRRFWGRFQKNLVVWKLERKGKVYRSGQKFQKNLVVWKLSSLKNNHSSSTCVSEELSSVETRLYEKEISKTIFVSEELSSVETISPIKHFIMITMFQKNLVVWKLPHRYSNIMIIIFTKFQKNLVVWKLNPTSPNPPHLHTVSEELSSVETVKSSSLRLLE